MGANWNEVPQKLRAALLEALRRGGSIYLFGLAGRGKSCAAASVYCHWPEKAVEWHESAEVVRRIITGRMSPTGHGVKFVHGQSYEDWPRDILRRIDAASLVVFDDVGVRDPSEAGFECWLDIINRRAGKRTLYTGNLTPDQLSEVYDARVASRLCSGTVIRMNGEDRRLKSAIVVDC